MGLLLLFSGLLALMIPSMELEGGSKLPVGGFVTAGCWILGAALLSGHLLVLMAGWFRPFCSGSVSPDWHVVAYMTVPVGIDWLWPDWWLR